MNFEPPCDYNPSDDWVHIDDLKKYDDAKDFLEKVISHIYITGDINQLEDALDELVNIFELELPKTKPTITGK